jgi:hypothetical protein
MGLKNHCSRGTEVRTLAQGDTTLAENIFRARVSMGMKMKMKNRFCCKLEHVRFPLFEVCWRRHSVIHTSDWRNNASCSKLYGVHLRCQAMRRRYHCDRWERCRYNQEWYKEIAIAQQYGEYTLCTPFQQVEHIAVRYLKIIKIRLYYSI